MSRTRTNIELDDGMVEAAMRLYGTRSKQETVDPALRRLVESRLGADEAFVLEGSGWEGDLGRMRDDAPPVPAATRHPRARALPMTSNAESTTATGAQLHRGISGYRGGWF